MRSWCKSHSPFYSRPQRPRSFWSAPGISTSGQVQKRKSAIHGLPVTLRMLRETFDKSDCFWSQSIVFTSPFKTGMLLDRARGRDSWCWPKEARPLGTRMSPFDQRCLTTRHSRQIRKSCFRFDCARVFKFHNGFWTCVERATVVSSVGVILVPRASICFGHLVGETVSVKWLAILFWNVRYRKSVKSHWHKLIIKAEISKPNVEIKIWNSKGSIGKCG